MTADGVDVEEVLDADPETVAALQRLLPQVSSRARDVTVERLRRVLDGGSTRVFVARLDGRVVGMALLLTLTTLTGRSGYVEEVAVDETARGRGVGRALIDRLLEAAAADGLDFVDLTSRSSRVAANRLYRSAGFELRDTNPYRHRLHRD